MRQLLLFLLIFCGIDLSAAQLKVSLHAEKAILINAKTGAVLFEKEAEVPAYPASTTKIATALYVIEKYGEELERVTTVKKEAIASITPQAKRDSHYRSPSYWLETDGTHVGLKAGEELSLYHLIHAALISSANDACNVLAMACHTTVPKFMQEVNVYLRSIGCQNTTFNNPHGLHHPEHMTTAHDLARMAQRGLQLPFFRQVVGTTRYVCPRSNLEEERTFVQTNLFLRQGSHFDARVMGIKTGGTQAAGKNLVSAAREGDRELITVVMGCKTRSEVYQDSKALFDAAFSEPLLRRIILPIGPSALTCSVPKARGALQTMLPEELSYTYYPSEERPVQTFVGWELPPLPIKAGMQVGTVYVVNEQGTPISSVPLCAAADLKRSRRFLFYSLPFLGITVFTLLFVSQKF